jgi:hypothetical protein
VFENQGVLENAARLETYDVIFTCDLPDHPEKQLRCIHNVGVGAIWCGRKYLRWLRRSPRSTFKAQ